jgi:hypothetical protein
MNLKTNSMDQKSIGSPTLYKGYFGVCIVVKPTYVIQP